MPVSPTINGDLVPLDEQDRSQWDRQLIDEAMDLVKDALAMPALGPYLLQASIAATHANAATAAETDWRQVPSMCHLILERINPNPMVTLNRAVAALGDRGPGSRTRSVVQVGLRRENGRASPITVGAGESLGEVWRRQTVRMPNYRRAAKSTASIAEQRFLENRATQLKLRIA